MNKQLQNDLETIDVLLDTVKQQGVDYLNKLNDRQTSSAITVQLTDKLRGQGLGSIDTLHLFNKRFEPAIVGSGGPRYWGFVTGGATPAAILGDMLATFYDQNPQAVKGQGDVSALIELETIQLLLDLFGLPHDFSGGFVTGATLSNFTCLAVARQWFGRQQGRDIAKEGMNGPVKILSAVPHSSVVKCLSMLGIGSNNIEKINVMEGNREAMDVEDLQHKIELLHGAPFILAASAGTVNTVDFDNFEKIAALKKKYNFWLHIDGAFGAFAACSPLYKHLLNGWEMADSISIDCHKWMNVPYENAFFLVKEKHKLLQTETFQNSNAPYLGDPSENFSYLNFLPENSRRLRALPVWFTINAYGKDGYKEIIENSVLRAKQLGQFIEQSAQFELLAPVRLNNVCFTLKNNHKEAPRFLKALNDTQKVFMTPTIYNGKDGIRASLVNWRTTERDVETATQAMSTVINEMMTAEKAL